MISNCLQISLRTVQFLKVRFDILRIRHNFIMSGRLSSEKETCEKLRYRYSRSLLLNFLVVKDFFQGKNIYQDIDIPDK